MNGILSKPTTTAAVRPKSSVFINLFVYGYYAYIIYARKQRIPTKVYLVLHTNELQWTLLFERLCFPNMPLAAGLDVKRSNLIRGGYTAQPYLFTLWIAYNIAQACDLTCRKRILLFIIYYLLYLYYIILLSARIWDTISHEDTTAVRHIAGDTHLCRVKLLFTAVKLPI
jgi:hypothetical protein